MTNWNVGAQAWIINGTGTRAFLVRIFSVDEAAVTVVNEDKSDEILVFDLAGEPLTDIKFKGSPPHLVPFEDAQAALLELARMNRAFNEDLHNAGNAYRDDPSDDTLRAMVNVIKEWTAFNGEQAES